MAFDGNRCGGEGFRKTKTVMEIGLRIKREKRHKVVWIPAFAGMTGFGHCSETSCNSELDAKVVSVRKEFEMFNMQGFKETLSKIIRRLPLFLIFAFCALFIFSTRVSASARDGAPRRVVLFALDGVTWEDIAAAKAPNMKALAARGAVAAMNNTTGTKPAIENSYRTLASGIRAGSATTTTPLVDVLETTGITTAAVMGGTGECEKEDNQILSEIFKIESADARFISVRHGEAWNAARCDGGKKVHLTEAMESADEALGFILKQIDLNKDVIIVISASGRTVTQDGKPDRLSPFIIAGRNIPRGFAISKTTFTPGVVANIDVMPTVLSMFGAGLPEEVIGKPAKFVESKTHGMGKVRRIAALSAAADRFRQPACTLWGVLHGPLLIVFFIWLAFPALRRMKLDVPLRIAALSQLFYPSVCLFIPLIQPDVPSAAWFYSISYGTSLILGAAVYFAAKDKRIAPIIPLLLLPAVVILDEVLNTRLAAGSIFGFSYISGKRFYGIGNEYMALSLGAAIYGAALLSQRLNATGRRAQKIVAIVLLPVAFVIGCPGLGTNTGGLLTAITAIIALAASIGGGRFKAKHVAAFFALAVILLAAFAASDVIIGRGSPTHMGETVQQIKLNGAGYFFDMLARKAEIHANVFRYTKWPYLFLPFIILSVWMYRRGENALYSTIQSSTHIKAAATALIISAIGGYLFNDSGIPIPSLMLAIAGATMMWLMMEDRLARDAAPRLAEEKID